MRADATRPIPGLAEEDVDEIIAHVALDNLKAALKLADRIESDLAKLSSFPELGCIPRDSGLRRAGYRYLIVTDYPVFYTIEKRTVIVEGAKLTDREVERLLARLEIKSFETRDEQEVAGYAEVMETVFDDWEAIPLTENYIRQRHRDLLEYSTKDERHRGAYKTLSNDVEAFDPDGKPLGVVFETASPFDTPQLMSGLVDWTRRTVESREIHPLITIAVFVVKFLAIHPFQDRNGRLSRILTILLLLRAGYAYVPYSSLESVIEGSKERYYIALRQSQSTLGKEKIDWHPWSKYFLSVLVEQKSRLEKKIERERVLLGDLPELSVRILELCRERGRVTVGDIAKVTGVSRNTIKGHVSALTDNGYLARRGAGRGTWHTMS